MNDTFFICSKIYIYNVTNTIVLNNKTSHFWSDKPVDDLVCSLSPSQVPWQEQRHLLWELMDGSILSILSGPWVYRNIRYSYSQPTSRYILTNCDRKSQNLKLMDGHILSILSGNIRYLQHPSIYFNKL